MKKLYYIFIIVCFGIIKINAQINLVPNPSFEVYDTCPNNASQLIYATPWFQPSTGTPDYFNSCSTVIGGVGLPLNFMGYSYAHTGTAMAGELFYDNVLGNVIYREYMAIKLTATLVNNQKYYVTYFMKLADSSRYATNDISILFRSDSIHKTTYDTIATNPQITNAPSNFITSKTTWTKLKGSFTANGTEKYMYIGSFKPQKTNDTIPVLGGGLKSNYNYPYYYFDDICVSTDSSYTENWVVGVKEIEQNKFKFYPNPLTKTLFLENYKQNSTFKIYNIYGDEMQTKLNENKIDFSTFEAGVYFIQYSTSTSKSYIYKLIKQ